MFLQRSILFLLLHAAAAREFIHEVDGVGFFLGDFGLGPVDFAFVAGVVADADGAEIALVVAHVGAATGHGDAVPFLLALLGDDVAPFDDAGLTVVDDGFVAHAHAGGDVGGQAISEAVRILSHLLLGQDGRAPWFVTADDAVIGKGRMNLVRIAVRGMVQGLVVGAHRAGEETRVAHFVVSGLEDGLTVGREVGNEGVMRVHPDLFQQFRGAKVRDHEEGDLLDGPVHDELEHALQGDAAAADGLEDRREGRAVGVELREEAVGEGADAVQPLEAVIGRVHRRCLVPEQFLFPEEAHDFVGLACAERVDKGDVGGILPDILWHVLVESFQGASFPDRQVFGGLFPGAASGKCGKHQYEGKGTKHSCHGLSV